MRSPTIRIKHIQVYKDRHGKERCYLRVPGKRAIALPSPSSHDFAHYYMAAMQSLKDEEPERKYAEQSLCDLIERWYGSAHFKSIKPSTQTTYRRILEYMRAQPYAQFHVMKFRAVHIRHILEARASTPARANHILRMFRIVFSYAIEIGWLENDPTIGVKRLKTKEEGVAAWTEEQIEQYERRWPIGTRQRLAFALLLYTGQRRSDVVEMGEFSIKGGAIRITQAKTGAYLEIPMHAQLVEAIKSFPCHGATFLQTASGKKCSSNGFYNQFVKWCAEAGLPSGCSPHGLRKAAARRLAEAGCTTHQIASITGHSTLAEVERYTKSAQRKKLAEDAMATLQRKGIV
ncbi:MULTISPECIES: site-specific integrase [Acetobacter]|uniref:Integrase n=1 Tax=Acetobacter lovaniensis TaxID=104100 RepID=A0A841QE63_9PROT|nr:site-specific integrase [Acetobacter lovaniensis]MBB6457209.1 integrase [Acetobacter lovaniensis]